MFCYEIVLAHYELKRFWVIKDFPEDRKERIWIKV